jgi:CRISPR-associated protein Cas5t
MNGTSLRVSVPFCSFRKPYAREYLESERFPPPATVYGFLLSFVGEEDRHRHIGTRLALAVVQRPAVSIVLRTAWRVKNKKAEPGTGNNKRPDYQEVLSGLVFGVWVGEGPLADRLTVAARNPERIDRFGGLSLGESRDLVDQICFRPCWESHGLWLVPNQDGKHPLPVWVDHVGSKGTKWVQFTLREATLADPGPDDERWITISPP